MKLDRTTWLWKLIFASVCVSITISAWGQTNVSFQYFYDDLGQLTKVVDSTGTIIEYVYDPVGNILQIKRSSIAPTALVIFNFTPQSGGPTQTVTIQGQAFDPNSTNDIVQVNGTTAQVLFASPASLAVAVPVGATTGPISVTVAGQTATSTNQFTVIGSPVITAMSCKSALFHTTIPNVQVSGINLSGAEFVFAPAFSPPAIKITSTSVDPSGTSATLGLQTAAQPGTFALVATNSAGSSNVVPLPNNRFTVVDPRSNADTSGNGFPDVLKAVSCEDIFSPNSIPRVLPAPEADGLTVSLLNGSAPPHASPEAMEVESVTVSLLNGVPPTQTGQTLMEADSLTLALVNGTLPPSSNSSLHEADSPMVSLVNGTAPPVQPMIFEADSHTVSLLNSTPKTAKEQRNGKAFESSLKRGQRNLQSGSNFRKRSSAKPKSGRRTQSSEGE